MEDKISDSRAHRLERLSGEIYDAINFACACDSSCVSQGRCLPKIKLIERSLALNLTAAHVQGTTPQLSAAARDVIDERDRQQTGEGWTSEHDAARVNGEMAGAAAAYALYRSQIPIEGIMGETMLKTIWLVRAGALILAEIERLDRRAREALAQLTAALGGTP